MLKPFVGVLVRDLLLAWRGRADVFVTLGFFVIVACLFPFGVGAEPKPPRLGPSSEANVMWPLPPRDTVASFRNGVTEATSASKTISRRRMVGSSPSGV